MSQIVDYTNSFQRITERVLDDMFGVTGCMRSPVLETNGVATSKTFIVSVQYTGSVHGEYLLALDERAARELIGMTETPDDRRCGEGRDVICDALAETLNVVVGEAIVDLQNRYAKLTITAPRIYFGEIRYPNFRTGKAVLQTPAGEVECFFCLDEMRLSLAQSYHEAMNSLIEINDQLKEANRHLAEQQAQLVQAEKMASIGVLASGVAHEINNPLFYVDMNLEAVMDNVGHIGAWIRRYEALEKSLRNTLVEESDSADGEDEPGFPAILADTKLIVEEARDGVERIRTIVKSLKDFSDVDRSGWADADVNLIIKSSCNLISQELPAGCEVTLDLSDLPTVLCNAGEIGQVLLHLLKNASQAVDGGGCIRVQSQLTDDEVVIRVEDNGHGIAEDHLDRLFDPFFSTRAEGEGKGLGLAVSFGLIKKHEGTIAVESKIGEKTTVTVRLPRAVQPALC